MDWMGWWGQQRRHRIRPVKGRFRRWLTGQEIELAGYPGDKARFPCGLPYRSSDLVVDTALRIGGELQDLLLYRADTSVGMSGSPVWTRMPDGDLSLVGVHSSYLDHRDRRSGRLVRSNVGAMITPDIYRRLKYLLYEKNSASAYL